MSNPSPVYEAIVKSLHLSSVCELHTQFLSYISTLLHAVPVSVDARGPGAGGSAALWRFFSSFLHSFSFPSRNHSAHANWHSHRPVVLIDLVKSSGWVSWRWRTYLVVFTMDARAHAGVWAGAIFVLSRVCVLMGFGHVKTHADDTIAWGDILCSVLSTVCVYVCYSLDMQSCGSKQWAGTLSQQLSKPECTH